MSWLEVIPRDILYLILLYLDHENMRKLSNGQHFPLAVEIMKNPIFQDQHQYSPWLSGHAKIHRLEIKHIVRYILKHKCDLEIRPLSRIFTYQEISDLMSQPVEKNFDGLVNEKAIITSNTQETVEITVDQMRHLQDLIRQERHQELTEQLDDILRKIKALNLPASAFERYEKIFQRAKYTSKHTNENNVCHIIYDKYLSTPVPGLFDLEFLQLLTEIILDQKHVKYGDIVELVFTVGLSDNGIKTIYNGRSLEPMRKILTADVLPRWVCIGRPFPMDYYKFTDEFPVALINQTHFVLNDIRQELIDNIYEYHSYVGYRQSGTYFTFDNKRYYLMNTLNNTLLDINKGNFYITLCLHSCDVRDLSDNFIPTSIKSHIIECTPM